MMAGPIMLVLFMLTALLVDVSLAQSNCNENRTQEVEGTFTACVMEARQTGEKEFDADARAAVCKVFEESVNKCGEKLGECFSEADVRFIKDKEIVETTKYYDGKGYKHYYWDCPVVAEFRWSKRKAYKVSNLCSLDQVDNSILQYKECSNREREVLNRQVMSSYLTARYDLGGILCNHVNKTDQECTKQLRKCMSPGELEVFLKEQYSKMMGELSALYSDFNPEDCLNEAGHRIGLSPLLAVAVAVVVAAVAAAAPVPMGWPSP